MDRPQRVRLRRYHPSDFRPVVALWRASGIEVGPSDTVGEIERARRRDPGLFLVAEVGGRLAGVVLGRFDGRRGWIHHLAVGPAFRHQGIGRSLVSELERRLARAGCPKVNLHVKPSNREVVAFYERLGYGERDMLFLDKWLRPGPSIVARSVRPAARARRAVRDRTPRQAIGR